MTGPDAYGDDCDDCDDYEYDLVHDEIDLPAARHPVDARGPASVDAPTDELGDYGYDLAHDFR